MQLRYYQQEALDALYRHLSEKTTNPCVVIPTGGGKTPLIATFAREAAEGSWRVLIVAHVKELLEQAADKLRVLAPGLDVGIYSASLKSRDTKNQCVIAGIQSIYDKSHILGAFDAILIDEAHLIPPSGEGMYQTFLNHQRTMNPKVRVVGLTATPYRMSTGIICGKDNILHEICYEIGVKDLIARGYLSKLVGKDPLTIDTSSLHSRVGEFIASECESLMTEVTTRAIDEVLKLGKHRKSILVFASGVKHAERLQEVIQSKDPETGCELVTGDTLPGLRDSYVAQFKTGEIRWLINVGVFTTGFDAPNVDCVVLMRPTLSPGLYYQMVGRGFRLSPGKEECLILDFGGNIERHGPIDQIKPRHKREGEKREKGDSEGPQGKKCPKCLSVVAVNYQVCPDCGFEFPPKITESASEKQIITEPKFEKLQVKDVIYSVHTKKGAEEGAPRSLKVEYIIGSVMSHSEWISLEHQNAWVVGQAEKWWKKRCKLAMPRDAETAVMAANEGLLAFPKTITIKDDGSKYPKIINHELGPIPDPTDEQPTQEWDGYRTPDPIDFEDAPF